MCSKVRALDLGTWKLKDVWEMLVSVIVQHQHILLYIYILFTKSHSVFYVKN